MRKVEQKELNVDELIVLRKNEPVLYHSFRNLCMLKGYAELLRFTRKYLKNNGEYDYFTDQMADIVLDPALGEQKNLQLAKLLVRMVKSTQNATEMYYMFRGCDMVIFGGKNNG